MLLKEHPKISFRLLMGLLLLKIALATTAAENSRTFPIYFDFGDSAKSAAPWVGIHYSQGYDESSGYGFVQSPDTFYIQPGNFVVKNFLTHGVRAQGPIEFRVDLTPGRYVLELFMEGGDLSNWQGLISANGLVLADTLRQFRLSFEGKSPPKYWSLLRRINIRDDSLSLKIHAYGQPTTISALLIYKDKAGPLRLIDGEIIPGRPLLAPNSALALKLLNQGKPYEAERLIDAIPEQLFAREKAALLLALAGRLEVGQPRPYIEWAATLLRKPGQEDADPAVALDLRLAELYLMADSYYKMAGWDWARRVSGTGIFDRLTLAGQALEKIAQIADHPLYHRALWYAGKISFWGWVEQRGAMQKARAEKYFSSLQPYYPHNRLLRMYSGDLIPFEQEEPEIYRGAPEWAVAQHRALRGILDIIHYWVENRQAENGEMGGKYDDDVEMLRWWPIARLAADDSITLTGLRRLVDGVWNSDWIENGFSARVRDVEHASELVADTQPMMIGLDYGNPIYVERCMQSIRGLRDLWTGVNEKGHRHFRSSWYSATKINDTPPRDCDVPMNTRTVSAARWLAWYNRHPFAMQFLRQWSDAWLEDCLRTDKGKPYGVVPPAIRYRDDAIGGQADNWHHPGLFWDYYDFNGGSLMLQQFLTSAVLTGDKRYLKPIALALSIVDRYPQAESGIAPVGSGAWVAGVLRRSKGFARTIEQWRLMTDDSRFDDIIKRLGSDYIKFRLTGDRKYLIQGCQRIADATNYNRELLTTEAYFTDRVDIGNIHKGQDWAGSHLESMYAGGSLLQGFFPFYQIAWKGFGSDFGAIVLESSPRLLKMAVYNFADHPLQGDVTFWQLLPGRYEFVQGPDRDEDDAIDKVETKDSFEVHSRSASHPLTLAPRTVQIIHVSQKEEFAGGMQKDIPDLAITGSEIKIHKEESSKKVHITVPVHNIGIADAIDVIVKVKDRKSGRLLAEQTIKKIEAPLDLVPKIEQVEFVLTEKDKAVEIVVCTKANMAEITKVNNRLVLDEL